MATYYIGADVHSNNTELAIEQRKIYSILKVMILSFSLILLLKPSILSAQNTGPQNSEQSQEELNQALFVAVTKGRADEVKELITRDLDVNLKDEKGMIALLLAISEGHAD